MNDYNVKVWSRVICNHLLLQNTSFVVPSFDCQLSRVTVSEGIVYLKHSKALSQRLTVIFGCRPTSHCRGGRITSTYTSSLSIPFRSPTLYHYCAAVWKQYRDLCARPLCLPQTSATLNLVGVIKTERSHTQKPSPSLESAFPLRPRNVVFRDRMAAEQQ